MDNLRELTGVLHKGVFHIFKSAKKDKEYTGLCRPFEVTDTDEKTIQIRFRFNTFYHSLLKNQTNIEIHE